MIDNNTKAFFALVGAGLWGTTVQLSSYGNVDYEFVLRIAQEQSVVGLVAAGLEHVDDVKVPQKWALQFAGETLHLEQRNKAMNTFIADLIDQLRKKDIYAILVKGQGVAQCYEKPLWRSSGDVDLLLSNDNYEKAKAFLLPMGEMTEPEEAGKKHFAMRIGQWEVELHGTLHGGLSSRVDRVLDKVQKDIFYGGKVRSWMVHGSWFMVHGEEGMVLGRAKRQSRANGSSRDVQVFLPAPDEDVVYVFAHVLQHFYKGGIGLRQICDWCRLLYTYKESLNYGLLEQRIRKAGLMTEWKAFYNLASRYLGMPDVVNGSWLMVKDSRFDKKADRIMEFVLKSGNMGHNRGSWLMEHDSWLSRQYVVRKAFSMFRRIGDLINHARIFPLDSLRFFPRIMFNGVRSAIHGE